MQHSMVVFTAVGAAAAWLLKGRRKLKMPGLSDLFVDVKLRGWRPLIEFLVFIALGCTVGIAFAKPETSNQAITAGFSWTGLMSSAEEKSSKPKQDSGLKK